MCWGDCYNKRMTMHKLHLHKEPFELIRGGLKTIEARLYDERRQRIDIGDEITFASRENGQTLTVTVTKLHRAPTFYELFLHCGSEKFGGTSPEETARAMEKFYTYNDQLRYGVVGIEFIKK